MALLQRRRGIGQVPAGTYGDILGAGAIPASVHPVVKGLTLALCPPLERAVGFLHPGGSMAEQKEIRVLEIRAAENGWVISGFEHAPHYMQELNKPYFSMVAETPKRCTEIVGDLLKRDSWQTCVGFQPARRDGR
jgi:hypothetical protein